MDAGINPVNAFDMAMLRTQETGLGILVYTLVAIFLWPSNSYTEFGDTCCQLMSTQQKLFRSYRDLTNDPTNNADKVKDSQALRTQEIQQQTRFVQLLAAAETENYEIWELRRQWANYRGQVVELSEIMER